MLVKEEYAEQYCRKRLKCTEDGGKCRTDASYSLYSGEIGYHSGPKAESEDIDPVDGICDKGNAPVRNEASCYEVCCTQHHYPCGEFYCLDFISIAPFHHYEICRVCESRDYRAGESEGCIASWNTQAVAGGHKIYSDDCKDYGQYV